MAKHYQPNLDAARIAVGQPRDLDIFVRLVRNHHMRGNDIAHLAPGSNEHNARRIRALFDHGFLRKIPEPFIDYTRPGSSSHIYGITPLAAEFLRTNRRVLNIPDYIIRKIPYALKTTKPLFMPHRLETSATVVAIEAACKASNGRFRFIPQEEIIANAPEETRKLKNPFRFVVTYRGDIYTLTPDDVFGIGVTLPDMRTKPFYFIHEEDRDTIDAWRSDLKQSSIYRKIKLYDILRANDFFQKTFGIRDPRIHTVVPNQARVDECLEMIEEHFLSWGDRTFSPKVTPNHFLFATADVYRSPLDLHSATVFNAKRQTRPLLHHLI
jgi:hypothetical protein